MLNPTSYLSKLKEFEGSIPFLYLDTTGNVTVGVGNLLSTAAAAQKLRFMCRTDPPVPATAGEIQAAFDAVAAQVGGKVADYYRHFTRLDLPEAEIDSLLAERVVEFQASLNAALPDFPGYPEAACAAIFDMAYNVGLHKLMSEFPNFVHAVKRQDWSTAARHCERKGIGEGRNNWAKAQFRALVS